MSAGTTTSGAGQLTTWDGYAQFVGGSGEEPADVVGGAEPESAVVEAGGEALGEERPEVEDLEDFRMGVTEAVPAH